MGIFTDIALAVPIGIIYNMIIHETGAIFNNKFNYKDKVQRNLLLIFGGGLFGLLTASFILGEKSKYKNNALRYGLYLGSFLLLSHSVMYNWKIMQNDTKIIVMILTFLALIWYTYSSIDTGIDNNTKKKSKNSNEDKMASLLPLTFTSYEQYDNNGNNDDNYN